MSGINRGANLAEDVTYSGTVSAAMEGALAGVRSIALSQAYSREGMGDTVPFASAEAWAERVLGPLVELETDPRTLINVNFPALPPDDVNGILVAPRDEPALHAALIRLLADRGLRSRMGEMGRARVMKEFSQERVAAETMAVWRGVAANDGESR